MNWKKLLLAAFGFISTGLLSSCTGFETARSGEIIRNPTVDEMDRLQEQWGMPRRQVKPRYRPAMPGDYMDEPRTASPSDASVSASAPALQGPAPEPVPSPTPEVPEPPQPQSPAPPIPDNLR